MPSRALTKVIEFGSFKSFKTFYQLPVHAAMKEGGRGKKKEKRQVVQPSNQKVNLESRRQILPCFLLCTIILLVLPITGQMLIPYDHFAKLAVAQQQRLLIKSV